MMKQAILISLLAGAAAGAGSALVATTLTAEPAPKAGPTTGAIQKGSDASLAQQVASLAAENKALVERVKSLEGRALSASAVQRAPAQAAGLADDQVLSLEEKVAQLEAALRLRDGGMPKSFEVAVEDTLAAIEERKELEREQEREARRLERTDERVEQLTQELGLDAVQARELRNIMLDESSRREAMMTLMREGGDFANAREEMGKLRDETNERLAATLTPEQYDKYQETNQGGGRRGGFGGAFIGGGNTGGGGRGGRQRGGDGNN